MPELSEILKPGTATSDLVLEFFRGCGGARLFHEVSVGEEDFAAFCRVAAGVTGVVAQLVGQTQVAAGPGQISRNVAL